MGAAGRETDATVIDALHAAPERFDFVQAVRMLERAAARRARDPRFAVVEPVGFDAEPQRETVRLRTALELAFPATEIAALDDSGPRPELSVTLMGLCGVSGVLPAHYSQLVLEAVRQKNSALRDFLDMFNHRALSFLVRATRKYRLPLAYEHAAWRGDDVFGSAFLALIGMREPALQARQPVPDHTLVFYGGHFAHHRRTASALEQVLSDYCEQPVAVMQFQGRWVELPLDEQTRLGGPRPDPRCYATLGSSALVGSRSWDVQGFVRVRLGPLRYEQFLELLPGEKRMAELAALTRSYVGPALAFDVQLTLLASEVPPLVLSGDPAIGRRLGWNAWLPSTHRAHDVGDAIFPADTF